MITITTTAEQQREINEHWAKVRAGMHISRPHVFREFTNADVDAALFRSRNEAQKAAFMAGQIKERAAQ